MTTRAAILDVLARHPRSSIAFLCRHVPNASRATVASALQKMTLAGKVTREWNGIVYRYSLPTPNNPLESP